MEIDLIKERIISDELGPLAGFDNWLTNQIIKQVRSNRVKEHQKHFQQVYSKMIGQLIILKSVQNPGYSVFYNLSYWRELKEQEEQEEQQE